MKIARCRTAALGIAAGAMLACACGTALAQDRPPAPGGEPGAGLTAPQWRPWPMPRPLAPDPSAPHADAPGTDAPQSCPDPGRRLELIV